MKDLIISGIAKHFDLNQNDVNTFVGFVDNTAATKQVDVNGLLTAADIVLRNTDNYGYSQYLGDIADVINVVESGDPISIGTTVGNIILHELDVDLPFDPVAISQAFNQANKAAAVVNNLQTAGNITTRPTLSSQPTVNNANRQNNTSSSSKSLSSSVLLSLGKYQFGLETAAYQNLERVDQWRWQKKEVAGAYPHTDYIGPDLSTIELNGILYPHYRGGLNQINEMRLEANKGVPLRLVDGRGFDHEEWVVTRLSESHSKIYSKGVPLKIEFRMSLQAYKGGYLQNTAR